MRPLILSAVLFIAPCAYAQTSVDAQLIAARDTVWRAFFANDTVLLRRYIPPAAATLEGPPGAQRWSNRADIMRDVANVRARLVTLTFSNTEIVHTGHSALVHSNYRLVLESGGRRDTMWGRATELFVRQGGTWTNPYWELEERAAGAERDVPLPDTLGANFAIADSAKASGSSEDYDALDGTYRYAIQRHEGVLSRIRYLHIEPNSFLWRSDASVDGGRTWLLDAGTMIARRIAK
jgi:ketosteroid isomerase-like protein